MDFVQCIHNRRSIRRFKTAPVLRRDIEAIIDAARLAPTARNVQPWEFIVIQDKARKDELARLVSPNGAFMGGAPVCLAIVCQDTKYYLEDGAAATTQALLTAAAIGLGACWIAGDKKDYGDAVKDFLNVPKAYKLISLIALGHPDESPNPPKRPLDAMIHQEKF